MEKEYENPSIVCVKLDEANRITAVNSSDFITNTDGWTYIDKGFGDKFRHAQGNYFPHPVTDYRGICRYKLVDGAVVERNAEEMDADWVPPESVPTKLDRIEAQILYTALITDTLIEGV